MKDISNDPRSRLLASEDDTGSGARARSDHDFRSLLRRVLAHAESADLNLSFSENGGDSLSYVRFLLELEAASPSAARDATPTMPLREIASMFLRPDHTAIAIAPVPRRTPPIKAIAVTPNRFSYLLRMSGGHDGWIVTSGAFEVRRALDGSEIARVAELMQHRHETLRVRARLLDGEVREELGPVRDVVAHGPSLRGGMEDTETLLDEIVRQRARISLLAPFLLLACPTRFEGAPGYVVVLLIHHIAVDAIGLGIIERDLETLLETGNLPHSGSRIDYHDYAEQYLHHAASTKEHAYAYWSRFGWNEVGDLPIRNDRTMANDWEANTEELSVHYEPNSFARFASDLTQSKAGLAPVLVAAAARALARWTQREQSLLGLAYHGRSPLPNGLVVSNVSGWLSEVAPVFGNGKASATDNLADVRGQISMLSEHARSHGYLRHYDRAPRPAHGRVDRDPQACINIKLTKGAPRERVRTATVRRVDAPSVPVNQLRYGRAMPLTGGALWVEDSFKVAWDFNPAVLEQNAVETMLLLTHEELVTLGRGIGARDLQVLRAPWAK